MAPQRLEKHGYGSSVAEGAPRSAHPALLGFFFSPSNEESKPEAGVVQSGVNVRLCAAGSCVCLLMSFFRRAKSDP